MSSINSPSTDSSRVSSPLIPDQPPLYDELPLPLMMEGDLAYWVGENDAWDASQVRQFARQVGMVLRHLLWAERPVFDELNEVCISSILSDVY